MSGGYMKRDIDNASTDYLAAEIFSSLRKITNAVEVYSSKLKDKTGINASQLSCLLVLQKSGPLTPGKLSKKVSLSPSMITTLVDQLEKKELVVRNRKAADRRVVYIELTDKGNEKVNNTPPSFQELLMESLSSINKEEKKSLHRNLSRLLSLIVSEVLIDSSLLGGENKLVEVEPSILEKENNL
jgi:DNA-binding MarR family transcriptional regulator